MYNGIGLTTPRGSATSGHVTRNLTYVKPEFFRNKVNLNSGNNSNKDQLSEKKSRNKGNEEILKHNEKRRIEALLFELQENLIEEGLSDKEIESKINERRAFLEKNSDKQLNNSTDTHSLIAKKETENARIKNAFGLDRNIYKKNVDKIEIDNANSNNYESDRNAKSYKSGRQRSNSRDRDGGRSNRRTRSRSRSRS
jgi:serine/arginine repetitive matrix protein 2